MSQKNKAKSRAGKKYNPGRFTKDNTAGLLSLVVNKKMDLMKVRNDLITPAVLALNSVRDGHIQPAHFIDVYRLNVLLYHISLRMMRVDTFIDNQDEMQKVITDLVYEGEKVIIRLAKQLDDELNFSAPQVVSLEAEDVGVLDNIVDVVNQCIDLMHWKSMALCMTLSDDHVVLHFRNKGLSKEFMERASFHRQMLKWAVA